MRHSRPFSQTQSSGLEQGSAALLMKSGPTGSSSPLGGVRIVVTRPREQSARFVEILEEAGADVVLAPMIRVVPPLNRAPMVEAAANLPLYDWVVLTSVNGVRYFRDAVAEAGTVAAWAESSMCAIGPATAEAVEHEGGRVALIASVHTAEGLIETLAAAVDLRGKRVLLPQAAAAREILGRTLSELGAKVTRVEAYRTIADLGSTSEEQKVGISEADIVTFTSASGVRAFLQSAGAAVEGLKIASIGPITSAEVRAAGFEVDVEADPHTIDGLMAAILRLFTSVRG